jgi:hypothetical protein
VVFTPSRGIARWTHVIFLIERKSQGIHAFRRLGEINLVEA